MQSKTSAYRSRPLLGVLGVGIVLLSLQFTYRSIAQEASEAVPEPSPAEAAVKAVPEVSAAPVDEGLPGGDYEASEQISEDLSVSFPVDI